LREAFQDDKRVPEYLAAGHKISRGLPLARSIDDFLYIHGADETVVQVGKAAIVAAILEAERRQRKGVPPVGEYLALQALPLHLERHQAF